MLTQLRGIFYRVKRTQDPAAGSTNELLIQLAKRGDRGFRFRSLEEARCNCNVALALDLGIAVWEETDASGRGIIRMSEGAQRVMRVH